MVVAHLEHLLKMGSTEPLLLMRVHAALFRKGSKKRNINGRNGLRSGRNLLSKGMG